MRDHELHNEQMRQSELHKLQENQDRFYEEVRQLRDEVLQIGSECRSQVDIVASLQTQVLREVQGVRESFCCQHMDRKEQEVFDQKEREDFEGEYDSTALSSTPFVDQQPLAEKSSGTPTHATDELSARNNLSLIPFADAAASLTTGERSLGQLLQDSQSEAQRRIEEFGQLTSTAFQNISSATRASLSWQTI